MRVQLLDLDPSLGADLPAEQLTVARRHFIAPTFASTPAVPG